MCSRLGLLLAHLYRFSLPAGAMWPSPRTSSWRLPLDLRSAPLDRRSIDDRLCRSSLFTLPGTSLRRHDVRGQHVSGWGQSACGNGMRLHHRDGGLPPAEGAGAARWRGLVGIRKKLEADSADSASPNEVGQD